LAARDISRSDSWDASISATTAREAGNDEHHRTLLAFDERDDLSPEEKALAEMLKLLIEDYEEKCHPLPRVSPNASLNALMEDRGLKHKDIWPCLGQQRSRHGSAGRPALHQQGAGQAAG
jgi:antitoxin component HigA of HigAB toxin-antitoxin module